LGIINVASVAAFLTGGNASYCSTKAWMTSFTEGVALDLKAAGSRVRAQAFCPGFTYSEFHEAMGVEREAMAGKALWMTAEAVVAASLAGFAADRVYVVPGWRYKLLVALVPRLPARLRMAVTSAGRRRMQRQKG
jgi:short-subunit dehydrogenase